MNPSIALWRFAQERFPIGLCFSISATLFVGPALYILSTNTIRNNQGLPDGSTSIDILSFEVFWHFFAGSMVVFLALFCLRIIDDLVSIEEDRNKAPSRGLVNGLIEVSALKTAVVFPFVLMMWFAHSANNIVLLITVGFIYIIYFSWKYRLPIYLRPMVSSLIFPVSILYAASSSLDFINADSMRGQLEKGARSIVMLCIFSWFAVLSHEYSHDAHTGNHARSFALVSFLYFVLSLVFALLFISQGYTSGLFEVILAASALCQISLLISLFAKPSRGIARVTYFSGFLYFLLPLLALVVEALL